MGWRWISSAYGAKGSEERGTALLQSQSVVNICFSSRSVFSSESPALGFLRVATVIKTLQTTHLYKTLLWREGSDTARHSLLWLLLGIPLAPKPFTPSPLASSHCRAHEAMLPPSVPQKEPQTAISLPEKLLGLVASQHKRSQDSGISMFPGQPVNWKRSSPGRSWPLPELVSPTSSSVVPSTEDSVVMSLALDHAPGATAVSWAFHIEFKWLRGQCTSASHKL